MFKHFLLDPDESARTADFVVGFTLFGGAHGAATRRRVIVRTASAAQAVRLVKREYRRSADHRIVAVERLLTPA